MGKWEVKKTDHLRDIQWKGVFLSICEEQEINAKSCLNVRRMVFYIARSEPWEKWSCKEKCFLHMLHLRTREGRKLNSVLRISNLSSLEIEIYTLRPLYLCIHIYLQEKNNIHWFFPSELGTNSLLNFQTARSMSSVQN